MSRPSVKWIKVKGGTRRRWVPDPIAHSTVWRSSIIKFTLRVAEGSMLHVGSGMVAVHKGRPLILHSKTVRGYVIPGSTLKGAVAHYSTALYRDIRKTSSLFGWPGYMSRALFSDAVTDSRPLPWGVDPSWRPRHGNPSSVKLYDTNIPLRTVRNPVQYVEAFPPGTEFKGEIVAQNILLLGGRGAGAGGYDSPPEPEPPADLAVDYNDTASGPGDFGDDDIPF